MSKKTQSSPVPVVLALLLCDQIITEGETGKKTLVGVFSQLSGRKFPLTYGRFAIYARLADVEGKNRFRVRIVRLEDGEKAIGEASLEGDAGPSPKILELTLGIGQIKFPGPGTYEFQLYCNDIWIGRTTMTARKT